LAVHTEFKVLIGDAGAMAVLVRALRADNDEATLMQAARGIANLAVAPENRHRLMAEGAIRTLVEYVSSPYESVQEAVARSLVNLSYERECALCVIEAGGVEPITALLSSPHERVQQEATWVIVNFSVCVDDGSSSEDVIGDLLGDNVLVPLINMLHSTSASIQEQAAWALANLSRNPTNKMKIISLGALEILRELHKSKCDEVQAASGQVLNSIGQVLTPNSRRVIFRAQGHPVLDSSKRPAKGSPLAKEGAQGGPSEWRSSADLPLSRLSQ